jgi:hypothetical protein
MGNAECGKGICWMSEFNCFNHGFFTEFHRIYRGMDPIFTRAI